MRINIYQNYHAPELKKYLDPAFIPNDNTSNENPEFREYWLFLRMYERGKHKEADYTGLLSWKFNEKTSIKGTKFIEFIENNPGYDVYFINPLPFLINAYAFQNVWHQGDFYHPGLLDFMQRVMNKLNYGIDLKSMRNDESTTLFCNYWVGNVRFWDGYIQFTKPIYDYLMANMDVEEKNFVSRIADRIIGISYVPFVFERLFSSLLVMQSSIRFLNYRYSDEDLNKIPREDRTGILLLRSLGGRTGDDERLFAEESIRVLIQRILRDRQQQLETSNEGKPGFTRFRRYLDRNQTFKRMLKGIQGRM
jgi:hypothetical protein